MLRLYRVTGRASRARRGRRGRITSAANAWRAARPGWASSGQGMDVLRESGQGGVLAGTLRGFVFFLWAGRGVWHAACAQKHTPTPSGSGVREGSRGCLVLVGSIHLPPPTDDDGRRTDGQSGQRSRFGDGIAHPAAGIADSFDSLDMGDDLVITVVTAGAVVVK